MIRQSLFLYLLVAMSSAYAADKASNISVRAVDQVAYHPQRSAPATALSLNDATLSAQIHSAIIRIPVKVADIVDRGDVLLELDCRNAIAIKQSSQSRLSLAEYQLQRIKKLRKNNHASEEELRSQQSELIAARSTLKISAVDVERCKVVAPYRGAVTQRIADVGEWVNQGEPLIQFTDLENVELSVQMPDFSIDTLSEILRFDFVAGKVHYPVKLRMISEVVDKTSRTREVRLVFTDKRALPGQSGRLVWEETGRYLPASFLIQRKGRYGVFIVKDKHASFVVVPDAQEGRPVRVDLANDVLLIDKGRHSVNDNDLVNVIHQE